MSQSSKQYGLCECGCGGKTPRITRNRRDGLRTGDPLPFIPGHRIKREYIVDEASGCWIWQGAPNVVSGHGQTKHNGKRIPSHRWYYEQKNGPVPNGMVLDHLCFNTRCVNPEHLEVVSRGENTSRYIRSGEYKRSLSPDDIPKIRKLLAEGEYFQKDIAFMFNVSQATISGIKNGKIWYWVE